MGAFKATLEELEDAHLLLHVVDIGNPRCEEQIRAVERILRDLDLHEVPRLLVFNKTDLVEPVIVTALCRRYEALPISARDRTTFAPLLGELEERFWGEDAFIEPS